MRITAVHEDNIVTVDGVTRTVTWSAALPPVWHAIQWYGSVGEIEYGGKNEVLRTPALANLLKGLWDAGIANGVVLPDPPDDAIAAARAAVLDQMVEEAAKSPTAPQVIKNGAARLAAAKGRQP